MLSATGRTRLPVRSFCPPPVVYYTTQFHQALDKHLILLFKCLVLAWHVVGTCLANASKSKASLKHLSSKYQTCVTKFGLIIFKKKKREKKIKDFLFHKLLSSSHWLFIEPTCAYCTVGSYASLSICPSVRLSVCHTFKNSYLRKYYWQESETLPQYEAFIGTL